MNILKKIEKKSKKFSKKNSKNIFEKKILKKFPKKGENVETIGEQTIFLHISGKNISYGL